MQRQQRATMLLSRSPLLSLRGGSARLVSPPPRRPAPQQRRPLRSRAASSDDTDDEGLPDVLIEAAAKSWTGDSASLRTEVLDMLDMLWGVGRMMMGVTKELQRIDGKLDAMDRKMSALMQLEEEIKWVSTIVTLQWAMANAHLFSFTYSDSNGDDKNSAAFVKVVLSAFARGCSHQVPDDYVVHGVLPVVTSAHASGKEGFMVALSEQIHWLTGVRPRYEEVTDDDGKMQYMAHRV